MSKSIKLKMNVPTWGIKKDPELYLMNKYTKPKVFKSMRNELNAKDAQRQIRNYLEGYDK